MDITKHLEKWSKTSGQGTYRQQIHECFEDAKEMMMSRNLSYVCKFCVNQRYVCDH